MLHFSVNRFLSIVFCQSVTNNKVGQDIFRAKSRMSAKLINFTEMQFFCYLCMIAAFCRPLTQKVFNT